jgi:hypothetical protein
MKPPPMSPPRISPLRSALSLLALVFLCAACSAPTTKDAETSDTRTTRESRDAARDAGAPAAPLDKAQQELSSGIASYENGAYKTSARQLQAALTLGLEAPGDQAKAHKYLAFMHCVSKRSKPCREEFAKALAADPAFSLTAAEAGHPSWGPVFRKLKAAGKPIAK